VYRKLLSKGKSAALSPVKKRRALRVGFLPEADCAPVIVAQEFGLFERYGLTVELRSEASWSLFTINSIGACLTRTTRRRRCHS